MLHVRWVIPVALGAMLACAEPARALLIANDDASQSAYNDGWQNGDNGGTGLVAWNSIGNQSGSGSGGGFLATSNGNSQINTGSPGKAWGIFGNGGGVGQATRPFASGSTLQVGWDFSLDMDNGFIDTGGTVGFGLQNSSGQNLAEFFFVGGDSSYKVNSSAGSTATGVTFTNTGLHLTFRLTSANAFSMTIDKLSDGLGTNLTTATGNLITQSGGQLVTQLRLFNANAGNGGDHDAFFNSILISAVPEASSVAFGCLVCSLVGLSFGIGKFRRRRLAASIAASARQAPARRRAGSSSFSLRSSPTLVRKVKNQFLDFLKILVDGAQRLIIFGAGRSECQERSPFVVLRFLAGIRAES